MTENMALITMGGSERRKMRVLRGGGLEDEECRVRN